MIDHRVARALDSEVGWRALDDALRPFIRRRVRSEADVDDVLQDAFLRIHRGAGAVRDGQRFGPWVYQVARSALFDFLRVSARHPGATHAPPEEVDPSMAAQEEAEEEAVRERMAAYTALLVSTLPSPYREALTLTEIEGLTQKAGAEIMGVSLSGMKSRVQRGRQKLRGALEACCHIAIDARRRAVTCEPRSGAGASACCAEPPTLDPGDAN